VIHAARVNRIPKQVVTVKRLTDMAGAEESPAISPDGVKVAFVAMAGGKRQIWVESAITKDDADHYGPRWSPDSNSLIYFASGAIWEIPAAGGEARKLVDALGPGDLSRDGELAYFRHMDDKVELMVDGRSILKSDGGTYSNVRWSRDYKKVAYLRDMKVMVVNASGGEQVPATDLTVQGFAWAPDDSGLIVSTRGELWFIPRKERESRSQVTFGELSYESPDISMTGELVASRKGLYEPGESDIVIFRGLKW
jgi:Tol biopolymer transport system component